MLLEAKADGHREIPSPPRPSSAERPTVRVGPGTGAEGPPSPGPCYALVKSCFDRLAGLVLLILSAPLVLLAALVVRLTSAGPAFYSQIRVGRHGRPFKIYKLRTMYHNCESASGPRWSTPGDSRITPVGRFLRISHLDELPQLVNILRGDMSLIGPRPERPEFLPQLEQAVPRYRERLQVRPGVTGLAQVRLPADTDLDSVRRKLRYDLYYIAHLTPWLDMKILLCTGFYLFGVPFPLSARLFGVPGADRIEELPAAEPGAEQVAAEGAPA